MVELRRTELAVQAERAILVQVALNGRGGLDEASLEELRSLARTARVNMVGEVVQSRPSVAPAFYVGRGKALELARLCRDKRADVVICDDDLSPTQVKNLEEQLDTKVIDRSELILDIFATHARTKQAKVQVELAQLEYTFPRLKKMWTHLDRTGGSTGRAGVGVRGPGERQLETDRRLVDKRIHELKKDIEKSAQHRRRMVQRRNENFTSVALVGYTNAGKSTLMNTLTNAGVSVRDRLFETLDTRTRLWMPPDGRRVMLSDTVGFIRKLPHHLVASFQATLEEACEADLLLHVADASSPTAEAQIDAVAGVLKEIGCLEKPALLVLNKVDALRDSLQLPLLKRKAAHTVAISALTGQGLDDLARWVQRFFDEQEVELTVETSVGNGKLFSLLYEKGKVLERTYEHEKARLRVKVPHGLAGVIRSLGAEVWSS